MVKLAATRSGAACSPLKSACTSLAWSSRACALGSSAPPADAVEQQRADRRFQIGQRAARRRLRARDAVGCGAGAAAARRGHEHFELAQVEAQSLRWVLICFSGHIDRYSPLFRLMTAP
jgi:hypothetical protein